MLPSAYLLLFLVKSMAITPLDEMGVAPSINTLELAWSDHEDRLQGMISPKPPVADAILEISVHVGSFQGVEFDGPVTFSLKPTQNIGGGRSQTVKRATGEKAWRASFRPEEAGLHTLEISFSTTRLKVTRARISVLKAKVPRWRWWIVVVGAGATAIGLGVRSVLKKRENA